MLSLKRRSSRVEILLETRGVLAVDLIGTIIKTLNKALTTGSTVALTGAGLLPWSLRPAYHLAGE